MGVMEVVPLFGQSFQLFFPCMLLVFCLFNFFGIFTKVMKALGLDQLTFYNNYDPEKLHEGKMEDC